MVCIYSNAWLLLLQMMIVRILLLPAIVFTSFLLLYTFLWYEYTTVYLSTLLWIILPGAFFYLSLGEHIGVHISIEWIARERLLNERVLILPDGFQSAWTFLPSHQQYVKCVVLTIVVSLLNFSSSSCVRCAVILTVVLICLFKMRFISFFSCLLAILTCEMAQAFYSFCI
jgi:hypothetical protein